LVKKKKSQNDGGFINLIRLLQILLKMARLESRYTETKLWMVFFGKSQHIFVKKRQIIFESLPDSSKSVWNKKTHCLCKSFEVNCRSVERKQSSYYEVLTIKCNETTDWAMHFVLFSAGEGRGRVLALHR
jgi:hypothetical protein